MLVLYDLVLQSSVSCIYLTAFVCVCVCVRVRMSVVCVATTDGDRRVCVCVCVNALCSGHIHDIFFCSQTYPMTAYFDAISAEPACLCVRVCVCARLTGAVWCVSVAACLALCPTDLLPVHCLACACVWMCQHLQSSVQYAFD